MVQIFRPNIDIIRRNAALARESDQKRKEERDDDKFRWGDIRDGDGTLARFLPATNSRGQLTKLTAKHYYSQSALREVVDKNPYCIATMFPEVAGVVCPHCGVGNRILAQWPQLEIDRWHHPGRGFQIQGIDRADPVPLSRLFKLTPAMKNKLDILIEQLYCDPAGAIDLTDVNQGLDVRLTKSVTKGKKGKEYTKYDMQTVPRLSPIAASVEQLNAVLESMYDMDEIWKFPDDETIAKYNDDASKVWQYYAKKAGTTVVAVPMAYMPPPGMAPYAPPAAAPYAAPAQVPPPASYAPPAQPAATPYDPTNPGHYGPQAGPSTLPAAPAPYSAPPAPAPVQPAVASVVSGIANLAASVAAQPQAAPPVMQAPPAQPQPAQAPVQQTLPVAPIAPSATAARGPGSMGTPGDKPVCFAGRAARTDGGWGYSAESKVCLMCPHEIACCDEIARLQAQGVVIGPGQKQ